MNKKYGLMVSVLIHSIIFTIPLSMSMKNSSFENVELFVINDKTPSIVQKPKIYKKQVEMEKPEIPKEKAEEPEIQQNTEEKQTPSVAETSTFDNNDEKKEDVNLPAFLHKEIPVYPMQARKLGKEGKVVLNLSIDENGSLVNVEVVEDAGVGFAEAAINAVKKSTFLPAKKKGRPIPSQVLLPFNFVLEDNKCLNFS